MINFSFVGTGGLDRPIALAELVELAGFAEVVGSYAGFHGVPLTVIDPSGAVLVEGGGPAKLCAAVRTGPGGGHVCGVSADCQKGHKFYKEALLHDGSVVGW